MKSTPVSVISTSDRKLPEYTRLKAKHSPAGKSVVKISTLVFIQAGRKKMAWVKRKV